MDRCAPVRRHKDYTCEVTLLTIEAPTHHVGQGAHEADATLGLYLVVSSGGKP